MTNTLTNRERNPVTRAPARSLFGNYFPRGIVEDMFDQFLTGVGNRQMNELMNTAMDVAETEQAFEVKMDLPGVRPEDVDIQLDNNTLTIRGHRSEEKQEKNDEKQFHRIERYSGSFARSVVLPNSINEDEAIADFNDGVLKIVVPKTEDAKPRKIAIKK